MRKEYHTPLQCVYVPVVVRTLYKPYITLKTPYILCYTSP